MEGNMVNLIMFNMVMLAGAISLILLFLANKYICKYIMDPKKSKTQRFVLDSIRSLISMFLVVVIFLLVESLTTTGASFSEKLLSHNWWTLIAIFVLCPIFRAIIAKCTVNWQEWKIFKKWND
jgi:sterol desaturase/sphingolipid hydroxylase (fatty acid hydroxylase superfamily)